MRIAVLTLLLFASPLFAQTIKPDQPAYTKKPRQNVVIQVQTDCDEIKWIVPSGLEDAFPREWVPGGKGLALTTETPGTYTVYVYGRKGDKLAEAVAIPVYITPDGVVPPKPDDPKPPKPDEPKPLPPVAGLRVLLIYERDGNLTREQLNVINSTKLVAYLNDKCAKGTDGRPEWRMWDRSTIDRTGGLDRESAVWRQLWTDAKPKLGKLPQLLVVNDAGGVLYELPTTAEAAIELVKKHVPEPK